MPLIFARNRMGAFLFSGLALVGTLSFAAAQSSFDNRWLPNQPPPNGLGSTQFSAFAPYQGPGPSGSNSYATSPDIANSAFGWAKALGTRYLLPSLGEHSPDWAKRVEFETDMQRDFKPTYSVLTVQPLYQDRDKQNTIFVQASQLRYDMLAKYRDTTNIGLGYRRLLFDNQVLLGVNSFFDHEWTYNHSRYSVGGEVKWAMLDFHTNIYRAISGYKSVEDGTLAERPMSGFDFELRSQIPYVPWLRAGATYYRWKSEIADDIKGWRYSADADLSQNLSVEIGWSKDNFYNRPEAFAKLVFRLARQDRPVMLSDRMLSTQPFEARDMRSYTLDKVRRENKIIVERKSTATGSVAVARGDS